MTELALRTVFSLAAVLGLLALLTRAVGRRTRGRGDAAVQVLQRQALSRGSAVQVVQVGRRVLVLGTTEQQVRVLAELDPGELEGDVAPGATPVPVAAPTAPTAPRLAVVPEPALDAAAPRGPYADFAAQLLAELAQAPEPEPEPAPRFAGRHRVPVAAVTPAGRAELEQPVVEVAPAATAPAQAQAPAPASVPASGPLTGSVLSAETWRQTWRTLNAAGRRAS